MNTRTSLGLAPLLLASVTLAACDGPKPPVAKTPPPPASTAPAPPPVDPNAGRPKGQLSRDVLPQEYQISLVVDPRKKGFSGEVTMPISVAKDTAVIWMHGAEMTVSSVQFTAGGKTYEGAFSNESEEGLAAVRFKENIPAGKGTLKLVYTSPYDHRLKGLYHVKSRGKHYAFTQFEATSARYAFPCFDDPGIKVPFQLRVTVPHGMKAVSNTPVEKMGGTKEATTYLFQKTPALPTYLLALAVGELDIIKSSDMPAAKERKQPLPLDGVSAAGQGKNLTYALKNTPPLVRGLEEYFGGPYPFKKLHIIAVPEFAAGAMENPGAITFRESLLLINEGHAPYRQKKAFASVMAHELAHMWFGDLVTMKWWDDTWLNEAFATWMSAKIVSKWKPEYGMDLHLVHRKLQAMWNDSLTSSRQIRQPIDSDHDIRNAFDRITYSKGGGVLGMVENWLGEETFRKGIRGYMKKHARKNASIDDLLSALTEAAGKDVATPFKTFLLQPGAPQVDVKITCSGKKATASLSQKRYVPLGSKLKADKRWQVPLCMGLGGGKGVDKACTLLTQPSQKLEFNRCPTWVMPNVGGVGYYRFNLSEKQWKALVKHRAKLTPGEQLAAADSIYAAVGQGGLSAKAGLQLMEGFFEAKEPLVVESVANRFASAIFHWLSEKERPKARKKLAKLLRKAHGGYSAKRKLMDPKKSEMRALVFTRLVKHAHDATTARSLGRLGDAYLGWKKKDGLHREAVLPELTRAAVLAAAHNHGDEAFVKYLSETLAKENDSIARGHLRAALMSIRTGKAAEAVRKLWLSPTIRGFELVQDIHTHLAAPEGFAQGKAFVSAHLDELLKRMPTTRKGRSPWLYSYGCSQAEVEDLQQVFASRIGKLPGGPRNLSGAVEAIELCAAGNKNHAKSARAYFK